MEEAREITFRIEVQDDTPVSDLEQIIGDALSDAGVDCVYEIIE